MPDGRFKPKPPVHKPGPLELELWLVRQRLTQKQGAERIGISRPKLVQYLNGWARPSLETAIRIEDVTGIEIRCWLVAEPRQPGARYDRGESRAVGAAADVTESLLRLT